MYSVNGTRTNLCTHTQMDGQMVKIWNMYTENIKWRRQGEGDYPFKTEKNSCKKLCYFPCLYKMTNFQKNRIKKGKKSIFYCDFRK